MKHIAIKGLLLGGVFATAMCACDENSWNDEYLDGFEQPTITKTETVSYTLTAADIAQIAQLSTNKVLARQRGESALLAEVGKQGFFTARTTPEAYAQSKAALSTIFRRNQRSN